MQGVEVQEVKVQQITLPPISQSVLVAGYDSSDGSLRVLNLDTLRQLQVLAELQHILGVIDERDRIEATVAAGAAIGAEASDEIEVPAAEVWYLSILELVSPAESGPGVGDILQVNFRVSIWPDPADTHGQSFWENPQGTVGLDTFYAEFHPGAPLFAATNHSTLLRLPGGSKIRLEAVLAGAAAGANLTATLTPYGYKGKKLIA